MGNSLGLNDWAHIRFDGIFRIERIIQEYYDGSEKLPEGKNIGDAFEERTFILKGLVDATFEKFIHHTSCKETLVSELSAEQEHILQEVFKSKPDLIAEFERYEIPVVKRYRAIELDIKLPEDLEKIDTLISFVDSGRTFVEIDEQMQQLGIQKFNRSVGYMGKYSLNITNIDFECNNKKRIWHEAVLLNYEK